MKGLLQKPGPTQATRAETCSNLGLLKLQHLLDALSLHKKMPLQKVTGLMPTRSALSHPCPVREGALESLSPKLHRLISKDNSAAVLGGGSAGTAWHHSCLPNQTPCTLQEKHLQFVRLLYKSHRQPP